jgi:hypothetical protein
MKLYCISNRNKYTGSVHVIYKEGQLLKVDFSNCDMNATDKERMMKAISPLEETLIISFKSADTVIIEGEFELSFEDFAREYPYKRNTHLAREFWPKMKKEDQALAFDAASEYRKYCKREEWYKPQIADKWLKTKQYLNDWKNL